MDKIEDGGPAMPVQDCSKWQCHGLTLRDYFAATAMQAFNANPHEQFTAMTIQRVASLAYDQADAMLAARAQ